MTPEPKGGLARDHLVLVDGGDPRRRRRSLEVCCAPSQGIFPPVCPSPHPSPAALTSDSMGYSDTGGAVVLRVLHFIFKHFFFSIMASLTGQVRSDRFKQRISASKGGADLLSSES